MNKEGFLVHVEHDDFHAQIMIQEIMMVANSLFASHAKENEFPVIYRNHSAPKTVGECNDFLTHIFDLFAVASSDSRILQTSKPRARYNTYCRSP